MWSELTTSLLGDYAEPWDAEDPLDVEAANRKLEFTYGWFADPIYHGKYPDSMRKQLGDRLPQFTSEEIALVKGSNDFFGINSYGDNYIKHKEGEPAEDDFSGNLESLDQNKAGDWIGPETESAWLRPNPRGFRSLLNWLNKRYGAPTFYVTENGTSLKGENDLPREEILNDEFRCWFFRGYIGALADAVSQDGIDIRGYTGWSLLEYVYPHLVLCFLPVECYLFSAHLLAFFLRSGRHMPKFVAATGGLATAGGSNSRARPLAALSHNSMSHALMHCTCSNYEWHEGYRTRFGVTYVDYEGGQKRYPKKSALEVGKIFAKYIKKD